MKCIKNQSINLNQSENFYSTADSGTADSSAADSGAADSGAEQQNTKSV